LLDYTYYGVIGRLRSSETRRSGTGWSVAGVWKQHAAFFFQVVKIQRTECLRNVRHRLIS